MSGAEGDGGARLRRARREDIPALLEAVGGAEAARARAIRRVLKTLAADVYVLDRDRRVAGLVAVFYRRSVRSGGLVATIDALECFAEGEAAGRDLGVLVDHALERAARRGCVAVDAAADAEPLRRALGERGFCAGATRFERSLARSSGSEEGEKGEGE